MIYNVVEKKTENSCVVAPFDSFSLYKLGLQAMMRLKSAKITKVTVDRLHRTEINPCEWMASSRRIGKLYEAEWYLLGSGLHKIDYP